MKIKRVLKNILLYFSPFLIILIIIYSINIIIIDFKYAHKTHNAYPREVNWISYHLNLSKKKLENFVNNLFDNHKGLPPIKLSFNEKSINNLLSDLPISTKQYQSGNLVSDYYEGKVQFRLFTDSPANWLSIQKAIRVKLRKRDLINRKRYFEYKPIQANILDRYIAFKFAKKLDLRVPDIRLVELFINNISKGVFEEKERLNESFLRRNKLMPINLYKGEALVNAEKKIGLEHNLDANTGLWEKISIFNQMQTNDYSDIKKLFQNIRLSANSNFLFDQIFDQDNLELLARSSILEILLNCENGDYGHNRRIAIDIWSGLIHIIPHDLIYQRNALDLGLFNKKNQIDKSFTSLNLVLNQSSKFLKQKYELLYRLVKEERVFEEIIEELEMIREGFYISKKTDLGEIHRKHFLSLKYLFNENKKSNNDMDILIELLRKRQAKIIEFLESSPNVTWSNNSTGFDVHIHSYLPSKNLYLEFPNSKPDWVAYDSNNNQILDKNDKFFFKDDKGKFNIDVILFSNRIPVLRDKYFVSTNLEISNTTFKFFTSNKSSPLKIAVKNNFTDEKIYIKNSNNYYSPKTTLNKAIFNIEDDEEILKGDIFIYKNRIFDKKVKILEGTTFYIGEDVSIKFKNRVIGIGSDDKPIKFKKIFNKNKNWGSIIFHGKKTSDSFLKNIIIEDGSGSKINGVNYYSALSIHSAENLAFDKLLIKNNLNYDDMVHIVYSKDIKILNSSFINAYLDAIDIDISENIFLQNVNIINSGNDGVDLMESKVKISKTKISNSKDKGVSVGENSTVEIADSIIDGNNYGIASKDMSYAKVKNSKLINNKTQLAAYRKNWRYRFPGRIEIMNSVINARINNIESEEDDLIILSSSNIGGKLKKNRNIILNN